MSIAARFAPRPPVLTETRTAAFCAALIALGPVSLLLYTPALPSLELELGVPQVQAQLTVVSFFVGFAFAQLICGPISDGIGRRNTAILFLLVFIGATIWAFLAPDADWLIAARGLQGVGAAVGAPVARAIVRDSYSGRVAHRILNLMALMLGIGPAFTPFIGGLIVDFVGWRNVFIFMAAYGMVLIAGIVWLLPETNSGRSISLLRPDRVVRQYGELLRDRRFVVPTLVATLILSNFYAISNVLPFVLIVEGGLTPSQFGSSLLIQSASFTAGSLAVRRLMNHVRMDTLIVVGMTLIFTGAVALPVLVLLFGPSLATVILPLSLNAFAAALMMPMFWSAPLAPFGHAAGAAAAMLGFFQYGIGMLGSFIAAAIPSPTAAVILIVPVMTIGSVVIYIFFYRRMPHPTTMDE